MTATTLNQPNNTEHICFTIAQTFFSLHFPCLIVKVPDGAESLLPRGKKRKHNSGRHGRCDAHSQPTSHNKPQTQVASGLVFSGISLLLENVAEETCCNPDDLICVIEMQ